MPGLDEDTIFSILSHPLRRRILGAIYHNKRISFSEMSEEWGIKTGTLYFHLRELGEMLDQDMDKHYILTPTGKQLCQFFINDPQGRVKVDKINAFTASARPLYVALENSFLLQLLLLVFVVGGIVGSAFVQTILFGPLPMPADPSMPWWQILFINTLLFGLQVVLISGVTKIFGEMKFSSSLRIAGLANIVNYLSVLVLVLLVYLPLGVDADGIISFIPWLVISIASQTIYLLTTSGGLILGHKLSIEKSLLFSIIVMYIINSTALFFSL